jgi:hypothetical protein
MAAYIRHHWLIWANTQIIEATIADWNKTHD